MEIAPGVHHFTDYKFNWYLVEDERRITLIDSGFPGHFRLIRSGLAAIGRTLADVAAIVITRAHADHTGAATQVARASGASIYLHPGDHALVRRPLYPPRGGLLGNAWRPYTASMIAHAVGHGLLRMHTLRDVHPVSVGKVLDAPGTPGSSTCSGTPGDIVVHLPDRGILFKGDALVTRNLLTGQDGPPQFDQPSLNVDHPEAVRRLDRIRAMGSVTGLPGHGRPWHGDLADAVDQATADGRLRRPRPALP